MTQCRFCRIARGARRAHVVHADEQVVAFLDEFPIRPGRVQVDPRAHYPYFDDLPAPLAASEPGWPRWRRGCGPTWGQLGNGPHVG
jgi:hypothetical protein